MKRFIASEMWDKRWFRELTPVQKSFWVYLFTQCDCAGVWDEDFGLASFAIGGPVNDSDMSAYGQRVRKLAEGKWMLVTFISVQYGALNQASSVHKGILKRLAHHGVTYP